MNNNFISIRQNNLKFNFRKPRTPEDILKEMEAEKKHFYKADDLNSKEYQAILEKEKKLIKEAKKQEKAIQRDENFKLAKEKEDFRTDVKKKLDDLFFTKDSLYFINSRMPYNLFVKKLLPLTDEMKEKKNIVSEALKEKFEKAKEDNKQTIEIKLQDSIYKFRFV